MEGVQQPNNFEPASDITPPEQAPEERTISLGIAGAEAEDREIDDATARRIAAQLHGGQASALYSLASSGHIDEERVYREIGSEYEQNRDPEVREWLNWLGTYCLRREHKSPVDGWFELTADQPPVEPHQVGAVALGATAVEVPSTPEGDADARHALMERISAAGVTTLGQVATIASTEDAYGPDVDEATYGWRDAATWHPDEYEGERQERIDELLAQVPDEEIAATESTAMFRLLGHDGRPGGVVLSVDQHGQRRVWSTNSAEELVAHWQQVQREHEAFVVATGGQRGTARGGRFERMAAWPEPRIWLASLADYNNGRLHGEWLDAACDGETLRDAAAFLLRSSPEPDAEEWGIFDHEGFGSWHPDEYESLETVSRVAQGIEEHGPAFAEWVEYVGADNDVELARFEDHYRGEHDDMEAYVTDVLESIGLYGELDEALKVIPEDLRRYIQVDEAALARDWEIEMHVVEAPGGRMWVFDTNA